MMIFLRRLLVFTLLLAITIVCVGCKKNSCSKTSTKENSKKTTQNDKTEITEQIKQIEQTEQTVKYLQSSCFPNLYEKGEYYEVYTDDNGTGYYYIIYNMQDIILDEGYCSWKFNGIEQKNDLLELAYGTIGGPFFYARYYDLKNDRVSRLFTMPLETSKDLVAYFDSDDKGIKLVVQNIFDSSAYYVEFYDESFTASVFLTKGSASFSDGNAQITVTYPAESGDMMSRTLELK